MVCDASCAKVQRLLTVTGELSTDVRYRDLLRYLSESLWSVTVTAIKKLEMKSALKFGIVANALPVTGGG